MLSGTPYHLLNVNDKQNIPSSRKKNKKNETHGTDRISIVAKPRQTTRITTSFYSIETNGSAEITVSLSPENKQTNLVPTTPPPSPFILDPSTNMADAKRNLLPPPYYSPLHPDSSSDSDDECEKEQPKEQTKENIYSQTQAPDIASEEEKTPCPQQPQQQTPTSTSQPSRAYCGWLKTPVYVLTKIIVASAASAPSAINAMMSPSNKQPRDLGIDWWNGMSPATQAYSVWKFIASASVNLIFAYKSIPKASDNLKNSLLKKNQTTKEKLINSGTIVLAVNAAVSTSAITYNSFAWTNQPTAYSMSGFNLIIYFTTRYNGLKASTNRVQSVSDPDMKILNATIDMLCRTRKEDIDLYNNILHEAFAKNNNKMDNDTITLFALAFASELEHNTHYLIEEKSSLRIKAEYGTLAFRMLLALVMGVSAFPSFDQKGFDGINAYSGNNLDYLDVIYKFMMGFLPGVASAALYMISAFDFPKLLVDIIKDLYARPRPERVLLFAYLFIANIDASCSMEVVAEGILEKTNRIFTFLAIDNLMGQAYVRLNQIGGGITNGRSNMSIFLQPDTKKPQLHDFIKLLSHNRDYDHKLSPEATKAFERASLFARSPEHTKKPKLMKGTPATRSTHNLLAMEAGRLLARTI